MTAVNAARQRRRARSGGTSRSWRKEGTLLPAGERMNVIDMHVIVEPFEAAGATATLLAKQNRPVGARDRSSRRRGIRARPGVKLSGRNAVHGE